MTLALEKEVMDAVYLNFSKASNMISHSVLITKSEDMSWVSEQ